MSRVFESVIGLNVCILTYETAKPMMELIMENIGKHDKIASFWFDCFEKIPFCFTCDSVLVLLFDSVFADHNKAEGLAFNLYRGFVNCCWYKYFFLIGFYQAPTKYILEWHDDVIICEKFLIREEAKKRNINLDVYLR